MTVRELRTEEIRRSAREMEALLKLYRHARTLRNDQLQELIKVYEAVRAENESWEDAMVRNLLPQLTPGHSDNRSIIETRNAEAV